MMALLKEGDVVFVRRPKSVFNPQGVYAMHVKYIDNLSPWRGRVYVWGKDLSTPQPNLVPCLVPCEDCTHLALQRRRDEEAFAVLRRHSINIMVAKCKRWIHSIWTKRLQTLLLCFQPSHEVKLKSLWDYAQGQTNVVECVQ